MEDFVEIMESQALGRSLADLSRIVLPSDRRNHTNAQKLGRLKCRYTLKKISS